MRQSLERGHITPDARTIRPVVAALAELPLPWTLLTPAGRPVAETTLDVRTLVEDTCNGGLALPAVHPV